MGSVETYWEFPLVGDPFGRNTRAPGSRAAQLACFACSRPSILDKIVPRETVSRRSGRDAVGIMACRRVVEPLSPIE